MAVRATLVLLMCALGGSRGEAEESWLIGLSRGTAREWTAEPQQLSTRLVVRDGRKVAVAAGWDGLVLPTGGSFRKLAIVRACANVADPQNSECTDTIWKGSVADAIPPSGSYPASASPAGMPCGYSTLALTFASTSVLSFWSYGGQSEDCNPRGWQWGERAWVEAVEGGPPIRFSRLGPAASKAYASAAQRAEANWMAEWGGQERQEPPEVQPEPDGEGWAIRLEGDRPRPSLFQQPGSAVFQFEAPIEFDLTKVILGRTGRPPEPVLKAAAGNRIAIIRLTKAEADSLLRTARDSRTPAEVAKAFYAAYLAGGRPSGLPDDVKLRHLEPFMSKRFMGLLRGALEYQERWIAEHPPRPGPEGVPIISKPPLVDGALFSSLFEGPSGFAIGRVARANGSYRVELKLHYEEPGQPTFRWTDLAIVVKEEDRFVVDDLELRGDWPFGYHGRVSEILTSRRE